MDRDLARGALLGLLGGLCAAGAMSLAHRIVRDSTLKPEAAEPRTDDATVKVASPIMRLAGVHLTEENKALAGNVVHYAFGALVGAVYGAVAEIVPRATAAAGLPFGVAVWLGAHVIAVPALDLAEPPTRRPVDKEAEEFGLHLIYGMTTELVRRLLR